MNHVIHFFADTGIWRKASEDCDCDASLQIRGGKIGSGGVQGAEACGWRVGGGRDSGKVSMQHFVEGLIELARGSMPSDLRFEEFRSPGSLLRKGGIRESLLWYSSSRFPRGIDQLEVFLIPLRTWREALGTRICGLKSSDRQAFCCGKGG